MTATATVRSSHSLQAEVNEADRKLRGLKSQRAAQEHAPHGNEAKRLDDEIGVAERLLSDAKRNFRSAAEHECEVLEAELGAKLDEQYLTIQRSQKRVDDLRATFTKAGEELHEALTEADRIRNRILEAQNRVNTYR